MMIGFSGESRRNDTHKPCDTDLDFHLSSPLNSGVGFVIDSHTKDRLEEGIS